MAVSRPILLALLGAVVAVALFYGTLGARDASEDSSPLAAEKAGTPAKTAREPVARAKVVASEGAAKGREAAKVRDAAKGRSASAARARPVKAEAGRTTAAQEGVPAGVTRALERKRTVVLFFFQRGSADDDATAKAVDSVRGRAGVKVFSAPISRLADYRGVAGGAGVSRAPAIVILGRAGAARLIEGFVDGETLAQEVADAR